MALFPAARVSTVLLLLADVSAFPGKFCLLLRQPTSGPDVVKISIRREFYFIINNHINILAGSDNLTPPFLSGVLGLLDVTTCHPF
jgi:hypothetical protein